MRCSSSGGSCAWRCLPRTNLSAHWSHQGNTTSASASASASAPLPLAALSVLPAMFSATAAAAAPSPPPPPLPSPSPPAAAASSANTAAVALANAAAATGLAAAAGAVPPEGLAGVLLTPILVKHTGHDCSRRTQPTKQAPWKMCPSRTHTRTHADTPSCATVGTSAHRLGGRVPLLRIKQCWGLNEQSRP